MNLIILLDVINRAFTGRDSIKRKPASPAERIVLYVNNHLFEDMVNRGY